MVIEFLFKDICPKCGGKMMEYDIKPWHDTCLDCGYSPKHP